MKKLGGLGAGKEAFDDTNNINIGIHNFQNAPPPADTSPAAAAARQLERETNNWGFALKYFGMNY